MRMKALQRFPYNGQQLEIGDHFDVEHDIHGGIFEHKGWAEKADKQDAPKKQVPPTPAPLATRAMEAEQSNSTAVAPITSGDMPATATPRKRYLRRDQRAEE